ncbi:MAG TPA: GNAT family N-acetyltransferase [Gaiellaceae bacterium]|nr:GNAT family N-acetyltransferase [Gaiellaceae bacterium]
MIAFEPLAEADLPLIETWLRREHVARWWRDPLEVAVEKRRAAIEGRRDVDHYLIVLDGRPVGMIQTYVVADHPDWDEIVQVGPDAAGVDLFIGEPDLVGVGVGPRVLDEFVRRVVFVRPRTTAAVATVEEPNRRSWRAFEKAGFRHVRDVEEDGLPHRLLRRDRAPG